MRSAFRSHSPTLCCGAGNGPAGRRRWPSHWNFNTRRFLDGLLGSSTGSAGCFSGFGGLDLVARRGEAANNGLATFSDRQLLNGDVLFPAVAMPVEGLKE